MCNAGAGAGKQPDFLGGELRTMGVPDIIAGPFDRLDIVARAHAKGGEAVVDVLAILSQMRVHADTIAARHTGCLAHQIHAHRKW